MEAAAGLKKSRGRGVLPLAAVALGALALRLLLSAHIGLNPDFFDVDGYHHLALVVLGGGPVPTDGHPPGYSWFLAFVYRLVGPHPRSVYVLQAFLSAGCVLLAGDASRRRFGARAGLLTSALLALCGTLAVYPSLLLGENLCVVGVSLLVWLVLPDLPSYRTGRLLTAALVVSGLTLVRTGFVLVAAGLALVPLLGGRRPRHLALGALVGALCLLPAVAYAGVRARRTGVFRLGTTLDGFRFWMGNNPNATGRYEKMPGEPGLGPGGFPDVETQARVLGAVGRRYFLTHPLRELSLLGRRSSFLFAPPKRDLLYAYACGWAGDRSRAWLGLGYVWVTLSSVALGGAALLAFARAGRDVALLTALGLTALSLVPYLLTFGEARYLQPLYPFLAFAAGALGAPLAAGAWSTVRRAAVALASLLYFGNAAYDVRATDPALKAVMAEGGSRLRPSFDFAR